jgi:chemotaxis protein MotA
MGILMEGGSLGMYVGPSAAAIILGGVIGTVFISFPLTTLLKIPSYLIVAITNRSYNMDGMITTLTSFAEKSRREGILALEAEIQNIDDDFFKKGIQLVVDGSEPELVRDIMGTNIAIMEERHHLGASVFEAAGGFAPTMGIIGTVLGLVNVLSNLSEPEKLGGAIALAFIATLYGIGLANVVFLPIAGKLKNKSKAEKMYRELMMEGILSLQAGDNPRIVEEKLKAFLSQSYAKAKFPTKK